MNGELIMSRENLEDIMGRLTCCRAVFDVIHKNLADGENCVDALYGACNLLECICRDLQADIDCAELQAEKEAAV